MIPEYNPFEVVQVNNLFLEVVDASEKTLGGRTVKSIKEEIVHERASLQTEIATQEKNKRFRSCAMIACLVTQIVNVAVLFGSMFVGAGSVGFFLAVANSPIYWVAWTVSLALIFFANPDKKKEAQKAIDSAQKRFNLINELDKKLEDETFIKVAEQILNYPKPLSEPVKLAQLLMVAKNFRLEQL